MRLRVTASRTKERRDVTRRPPLTAALEHGLEALLAFNVVSLVIYNFLTYRILFHSDAAVKNIFAEEMLRQGSLMPPDWVYVHGDLVVFFGHLVIAPLLPFFENGFALHALSGTVFALLLLAATWWITRLLGLSRPARLLTLALFASGISDYFAENLYGQVSYGPLVTLMFVHGAVALQAWNDWRRGDLRRWRVIAWSFAALAFITYLANPERAFITFTVPLAAALVAFAATPLQGTFQRLRALGHRSALLPMCAYAVSATLATAAHGLILSHVLSVADSGKRALVSLDMITDRAKLALTSFLYLFGLGGEGKTSVLSFSGMQALAHAVLLIVTLGAVVSLPRREPRPAADAPLVAAYAVSLLTVGFLYIFTNLSENVATSRYFVPTFALGLLAAATRLDVRLRTEEAGPWTFVAIACCAAVAVDSVGVVYRPLVQYYRATGFARVVPENASEQGLSRFLQQHGLTYGYATYWNSHVVTVISGGKVKVRPIVLSPVQGMMHLSSSQWYRPEAHVGPTFLVLTPQEVKLVEQSNLLAMTGPPRETLHHRDYSIYVFNDNFGGRIPAWDFTLKAPTHVAYDSTTPHTVGRYVAASGDQAGPGWLQSERGEVGALAYGPYVRLQGGNYVASFDVAGCSADAQAGGTADISALVNDAPTVVAARDLRLDESWTAITVPFTLPQARTGVEWRVMSNGSSCLKARGVTVRRID